MPDLQTFEAFLNAFREGEPARFMEVVDEGVLLHCEWGDEEHLTFAQLPISVVLRDGAGVISQTQIQESASGGPPRLAEQGARHQTLVEDLTTVVKAAGFGGLSEFRFRPEYSGQQCNFEFEAIVQNTHAPRHRVTPDTV